MIKINLVRNRLQDATQNTRVQNPVNNDKVREGVVKLAFISLITLGLMMFESQTLRRLAEESARLKAQLTQHQVEAGQKAAEVLKVKDVEAQATELEDKLKILKLLSKLRLREVKTLDFMQSAIPEKVWLKSITYESDKIHFESGHFKILGNAVGTEDLSELVKRLEESAFLMDVIIVKNQEVAMKASSIRDFLFTAEVENKN